MVKTDTTLNLTTICHVGQQQQPGLSQRLPETDGAKVLPASSHVGFYLASTHQMAPPEHTAHVRLNRPATYLSTSESNNVTSIMVKLRTSTCIDNTNL